MIGLVWLVGIALSFWILFDARALGVKRGVLGSSVADMGPWGWFFASLLLWVVTVPLYFATRSKYKALVEARQLAG